MWTAVQIILISLELVVGQINFGSQSNNQQLSRSFSTQNNQVSSSSCCRPSVQCANVLVTERQRSGNVCTQSNGAFGICCTQNFNSRSSNRVFQSADEQFNSNVRAQSGNGNRSSMNRNSVRSATRSGEQASNNIANELRNLRRPPRRSGDFYHARFMRQARRQTRSQGEAGLFISQVTAELATRRGTDSSAVNFGTDNSISGRFSSQCSSNTFCSSANRYRSADGSCNNLQDGRLGKSDTVLNRLVLPEYADGVQAIRKDRFNRDLPSARQVSTAWTRTSENVPDNRYTTMLMSFGQFIDHDLTHSPVLSDNGQDVDCCSSNSNTNTSSAVCAPISIPFNDEAFRGRKTCMNLVRSTPGPALDCSIRYREQVNQITHFLDLSQVYGSTQQEQNELRSFRGGKLRIDLGPDGSILPADISADECKVGSCMKAGDERVNEVPPLSLLHTVFLREHNRMADQIAANNGGSDENIFQETRRLLIAKYQHIVYNEWLPIVLGKQYMNRWGLNMLASGYSNSYRSDIDPRITNEFAAAAFRFGHTLIPGFIKAFANIDNNIDPKMDLKDTFFKPELLRLPGMYDGMITGLTRENSQRVDTTFSDDVRDNLFGDKPTGMDLVALNIQRGREHGLAGYTKYKELCGLGRTTSFSGLSRHMQQDQIQKIRNIYNNVEDIDLFVGMLSERPMSDSILGPTALCIIGDQFARLRQGDRYFYDQAGQSGSFSSSELDQIRMTSFSRILCDNSNVEAIQPLAFQIPSNTNPLKRCNQGSAIPFATP